MRAEAIVVSLRCAPAYGRFTQADFLELRHSLTISLHWPTCGYLSVVRTHY